MHRTPTSFRIGKVHAYLRGRIWYLCYHEHGRRRRPRVGPDRNAARQLAAQVNAQLEAGAPAALSFEPVGVHELRRRWLEHHEQVLRSSVQTVNCYRTATDHLLRFLDRRSVRYASQFHATHAMEFVRYLRTLEVSPNGHAHTAKRPLMDKGLRYVLECCRALFNFAAKHRHLSPYAENPFHALGVDRIPVELARPVVLFTPDLERTFLESCDDWQFPLFLTLVLTGLRVGELCHLLLPEDVDLREAIVRVRNKPRLGWQVKTRNERDVPLMPVLAQVLARHLKGRSTGPAFVRRNFSSRPGLGGLTAAALEKEAERRIASREAETGPVMGRAERLRVVRGVWPAAGGLREDRVRLEFMRVTRRAGLPGQTAPKMLRHLFATSLQEANVDPLVRNVLMGHAPAGGRAAGYGLGTTAVYTHTRAETVRRQLEAALAGRAAVDVAAKWLRGHLGPAAGQINVPNGS
jgi:site-specific recombinase XerD